MTKSARISYVIMAVLLVLIAWLHVATLVLTAMFGYFALNLFSFGRSKILGLGLYIVMVAAVACSLVYFSNRAYKTLPEIAETTIPAVVNFAERQGIELPFTDYASLKSVAVKEANEGIANLGHYARTATLQLAMLIIGLVVAASLFLNAKWEMDSDPDAVKDNLYSTVVGELILRFQTFYGSFARVMGAQIIISIINTALTAVFSDLERLPLYDGHHYADIFVRVAAHHRKYHQQHAHHRGRLHNLAADGAGRAHLFSDHSQAGIFPEQ